MAKLLKNESSRTTKKFNRLCYSLSGGVITIKTNYVNPRFRTSIITDM